VSTSTPAAKSLASLLCRARRTQAEHPRVPTSPDIQTQGLDLARQIARSLGEQWSPFGDQVTGHRCLAQEKLILHWASVSLPVRRGGVHLWFSWA
jgi:hypothetical protein